MNNTVLITGRTQSDFPPFGFQTFYFEELKKAANTLGLTLFFADPLLQNLNHSQLKGYTFENGTWELATFPLPKIIYYRFSSVEDKELAISDNFKTYCLNNNVLFANPLPLVNMVNNKLLFHQFLENEHLADIPTVPTHNLQESLLHNWLKAYGAVYLKPAIASNGRGVKTIKFQGDKLCCYSADGAVTFGFEGLQSLIDSFQVNHILQPAIFPITLDSPPFDVRVMVQNTGITYQISGMGIRLGKKGGNISNLKGGGIGLAIEELNALLPQNTNTNILVKKIESKCIDLAKVMAKSYSGFCEIAFDVLIDKSLNPVILEANAKPGRWLFNKIADNYVKGTIKDKRLWQKYAAMRENCVLTPLLFIKHKLGKLG